MAVVVVGFCVVALSVRDLYLHPIGYQWFLLAGLTVISASATVKLPSVPASISISEVFVFTAMLLYGPAAGTLTVALDGLVISFWIARRRPEPYRALFNVAAPAVSAWFAAQVFFRSSGVAPLVREPATLSNILPFLFFSAVAYFGLNSWLITLAISAETRLPALQIWRNNFIWLSLNYFCGASVAALLVIYRPEITLPYIGAVVPLLVVLYFTFKTSMDRVEDANRHVQKVNNLYLSTVETLAMAIDAKDQVTHGHIRRVQKHATSLATHIGVRDEVLMRAIETAALLHDMGKLAVPEHILNKPGRLTDAEFEIMKLHASVGADILSSIDFPYPVIPIVRHHHENWDGSGYPAGLRGTAIPIGARILAVVDCFDALTSDRPYRPKLPDHEAVHILLQRRGLMYDPLVVDAFMAVHSSSALESSELVESSTLSIVQSPHVIAAIPSRPDTSHLKPHERLSLLEVSRLFACRSPLEISAVLMEHLAKHIVFSHFLWFSYDIERLDLSPTCVSGGERERSHSWPRVRLGHGLSGWVAANLRAIINSDPALDLGEAIHGLSPKPRAGMAAPVTLGDDLVGVVTLYASTESGFTADDGRLLESLVGHIGKPFQFLRNSGGEEELRNLPELEDFEATAKSLCAANAPLNGAGLLFLYASAQGSNGSASLESDEPMLQILKTARRLLKPSEVVLRFGPGCLVAVVDVTGSGGVECGASDSADVGSQRATRILRELQFSQGVRTTFVRAPADGTSLSELITTATVRLATEDGGSKALMSSDCTDRDERDTSAS